MVHNAFWWRIHLNNLLYVGRNEEDEDEWIGTQKEWNRVEGIINEYKRLGKIVE